MSVDNPNNLPAKFSKLQYARSVMLGQPFSPEDTYNKIIEDHLDRPCELIPYSVAGERVAYWLTGRKEILINHEDKLSFGTKYIESIERYIDQKLADED